MVTVPIWVNRHITVYFKHMSNTPPAPGNGDEPRRVRVNVMMDPDLLDRVRDQASDQDRSFSSQLNRNLRQYYDWEAEEEEGEAKP